MLKVFGSKIIVRFRLDKEWMNLQTGIISSSISLVHSDHSNCTAVIGIGASLWQPNILHFPFFDQPFEFPHLHPLMMSGRTDERQTTKHGSQSTDTHSFLYRHWLINAMLIVEINVINSKALKTCFTTCSNIIWSALHTHSTDIESSNATFGGNLYLLTGKMLKCLLKKIPSYDTNDNIIFVYQNVF
jgi:hypothetical protein